MPTPRRLALAAAFVVLGVAAVVHFELRRCANGDEPVSPPGSPGAAAGAAAAFVPRECDVLLMLYI